MLGCAEHFITFQQRVCQFDDFINTGARMLDYLYHITQYNVSEITLWHENSEDFAIYT